MEPQGLLVKTSPLVPTTGDAGMSPCLTSELLGMPEWHTLNADPAEGKVDILQFRNGFNSYRTGNVEWASGQKRPLRAVSRMTITNSPADPVVCRQLSGTARYNDV